MIGLVPTLALGAVGWYAAVIRRRGLAWAALPMTEPLTAVPPDLGFSVVVAARNEAATLPALLADLLAQQFPAAQFEIIVADDHSTDDTVAVVEQLARAAPVAVRVVPLATLPAAGSGKKAAVAAALAAARFDWVACTDADCRVEPGWLATLAAARHADPALDFLSGPVAFRPDGSFFTRLQLVEFAGLVGVGAASLALGQPNMCNGANLAYRRAAWQAVGGFRANQHVASGDDEFLLHALWARRPGSAAFVKSAAAVVRTAAVPTVRGFVRQRVRWASKWRHYQQAGASRLAAGVFLTNLLLLLAAGWGVAVPAGWPLVGAAWLAKLAADAWFLHRIVAFFGETRHLKRTVLAWQLLYVPYVVGTALLTLAGTYEWKGRRHQVQGAAA